MRILDVGCGRGWLTRLASNYGQCDGVEPAKEVVEHARSFFPDLHFTVGHAADVIREPTFQSYDIVITSEVIEHVLEKEQFVSDVKRCLKPGGYVILTTPRAELFWLWKHLYRVNQPIEDWMTERALRSLFEQQGFCALSHDRLSDGFARTLQKLPVINRILRKLLFAWSVYQVWLFRRNEEVMR